MATPSKFKLLKLRGHGERLRLAERVSISERLGLVPRLRLVANRRSMLQRMALLALSCPIAGGIQAGTPRTALAGAYGAPESENQASNFWVLSTRGLASNACCIDLDKPPIHVGKLENRGHYLPSDVEQFLSDVRDRPEIPTVIYTHGNRFAHQAAIDRAWLVYHQIRLHRREEPSIRFVLWSWPSEQIGLALKDVRVKAERTDAQGLYMAWMLRELAPTQTSLTLIGYSFGGRVVTGSLHALAGGALAGRRLPGSSVVGVDARVGLIAAAIEESWLVPGEYHGRASRNIEAISMMYNPRDKVLKRYWLLECDEFVRALGVVGRLRLGPRADGSPVEVRSYNCGTIVGPTHDELDYFNRECRAGSILARLIPSQAEREPVEEDVP